AARRCRLCVFVADRRGAVVRGLQPALRARLYHCHLQSAVRRMDRRVRVREVDRRAARSAHPPRPNPRNERRQLSPQTEQATPAPDVNPAGDQLATVLTAGKVRGSPCSGYCAWLCSSHPLRCAPWLGRCRSGRESRLIDRTGKLSLDVTELNRATPPISACDVFLLRPPMQFLSGVDTVRSI